MIYPSGISVILDTFALGDGTVYGIEKFEGLGYTGIRSSQFNYAGRGGGEVPAQYEEMRLMSLQGSFTGDTCADHEDDRRALISALELNRLYPVHITTFSGAMYVVYAKIIGTPTIELQQGGKDSIYKIDFIAPDPLIYEELGGDLTASVAHVQAGGFISPFVSPFISAPGSSPTGIVNNGDSIVKPIITLTGIAVNPVITNNLTGEQIKINITMISTDTIVIDTRAETIKLNGSSIYANKDASTIFWGLQPGTNPVSLDSNSASDTVTATINWKSGVRGI